MEFKKIFFPIGGGEELRERISGAILIAKYFNSHMEVFKSYIKPSSLMQIQDGVTKDILNEINKVEQEMFTEDLNTHLNIVKDEAKKLDVVYSTTPNDFPTVELIEKHGYRSQLIENESKYCDLVIVASPHNSKITKTFKSTVTKSGKSALMFPRIMKEFKTDNILIAWNSTTEISRAVTQAIPILRNASNVRIVNRNEFEEDMAEIEQLQKYLRMHDIETTFNIIEPTMIPGQALLSFAGENNIDLIVAGAFGVKSGFKNLIFGGTTKYILEHTKIPIFMSN